MKETLIGRSKQTPVFIKPKWYDISKPNVLVTGKSGKGISQHFVFAEENRNILVRGGVGKGKTALMKLLLTIVTANNQNVTVLDRDGEYFEYEKMGAHMISSVSNDSFLSQTEQEQCKQSDVVIIDEGLKWYYQDPERFLAFLDELEQANIRIFASFQAIPEELLQKFDVYLELDPLIL
ncbi:DnaA ATPase domain-containing protein [Bacillus pseudomycoides]|uniref:DnaA ATPase domain-containing protein n=1 Tax=Bacillus pseudomycoides TaxID=64104 RepID=UPI000BECE091|nr:type IV secretion system DNA-binding domain-containing protein [Bacillus pseudomycoides]PDY45439.1 hypothetical protein CON79_20335 [Bacillus pseudomycoides]